MSERHREIHNSDIMNELQNNQALLKTILLQLEKNSTNPETAMKENAEQCKKFKNEIEVAFNAKTLLTEGN